MIKMAMEIKMMINKMMMMPEINKMMRILMRTKMMRTKRKMA
jgi:hypothetical protein